MTATISDFGALLRHWREARRFSQLDLALQADVSSKHVSFLETGRNRPSREMILRLTQAMDVPLRDTNALLNAAGFAAAYRQSGIDEPFVERAEEALRRILEQQEPYPAIVLDADWNILRQNQAAARFGRFLLAHAPTEGSNALELLFSAQGLQTMIVNWEELSSLLLMRLWHETLSPECSDFRRALFRRLEKMPSTPERWRDLAAGRPSGPTVDMIVERDGDRLAFFTTVTTFGTPQDVTLQELRIESYFPSDQQTRERCRAWADQG